MSEEENKAIDGVELCPSQRYVLALTQVPVNVTLFGNRVSAGASEFS